MIMIQAMVEEMAIMLEIPLMLVVDQQVNLAATQGELVDQLVIHINQLTDNTAESSRTQLPRERIWSRDHPFDLIIGDPDVGVRTRSATTNECLFSGFLSQVEPKKVDEALVDPDWVLAMQEELNQFERQEVWALVPRPKGKSIIGARWGFRNKLDGDGIIVRDKD